MSQKPIGHIKNWSKFQHYKDRSPPWIKLQHELLDDFDFARLPIASKALAPLLWLLASESTDGSVQIDVEWLAFRLRWPDKDISDGLTPLIEKGFVLVASDALAPCSQNACLETEGETEGEGEKRPRKRSKGEKTAKKPMPEDFCVSDRVKAWASGKGYLQLNEHLESFKAKCRANGYTYVDWDSAFMEAIRGDWAKLNGSGYGGKRSAESEVDDIFRRVDR